MAGEQTVTDKQNRENHSVSNEGNASYNFDLSAMLELQYASRFTPTPLTPYTSRSFDIGAPANTNIQYK